MKTAQYPPFQESPQTPPLHAWPDTTKVFRVVKERKQAV